MGGDELDVHHLSIFYSKSTRERECLTSISRGPQGGRFMFRCGKHFQRSWFSHDRFHRGVAIMADV